MDIQDFMCAYPYSVGDVARKLGKQEQAVRAFARRKSIGVKVGREHRFAEADLKQFAVHDKRGPKEKPNAPYHGWRKKHPAKTKEEG
jgi:hypothetical protein